MSQSNRDLYTNKIVLVGDTRVGKTQIINRWVGNPFEQVSRSTVGIDFKIKMRDLNNEKFNLQIWDTGGQQRFRSLTSTFYKRVHGILLVFDVCNKESFENLNNHLVEIKANAREGVVIFLVANKVDLEADRVVTKEMAEDFARENKLEYVEFSAKEEMALGFESQFIEQIYSKELESNSKKRDDDLKQKIANFKKLHESNEQVTRITEFLSDCISVPQNQRQQFVDRNLKRLQQDLNSLYWTNKSLLNAVVNFVITILLAVSIVGLPIAYCTGLLTKNERETGHSLMFFRFGEYQATKAQCNEAFAEMNLTYRA
ncbi:MAG: Rab family GTPase [Gammaproteobacteria bacterium]